MKEGMSQNRPALELWWRLMEDTSPETELIKVPGGINAEAILAALRGSGISARTRGEIIGAIYGLTLDGLGEVTILVPESQLGRAREVLAAGEHGDLLVHEGWDAPGPQH